MGKILKNKLKDMKFFALIAAASAVRLASKANKGPTAEQIMDYCDASGDQMLSLNEVVDCIMRHAPEGVTKQQVHDYMKPLFDEADKSGDGLVDMDELRAAMKATGKKKLAKKGKGPSAADIIEACDADQSGGISKEEAHACIDAHISDESDNEEAHEAVDEHFDDVDKDGSGEVDEHELGEAMKAHKKGKKGGKGKKLAQQGPPSKKDIKAMVDHCDQADADGAFDGELSIDEVFQCFNAPRSEVEPIFEMVDKNGSGTVSVKEIHDFIKSHY